MMDIDVDVAWVRVVRAAAAYRKMEQDGTPRLWRGKELHEAGLELDAQLEALQTEVGEELWQAVIDL